MAKSGFKDFAARGESAWRFFATGHNYDVHPENSVVLVFNNYDHSGMLWRMGALLGLHVALSLLGIFSGFVAVFGMLAANRLPMWTAIFLWTTVLTSATGFVLPAPHGFSAAHALGILSLIALGFAFYGLYGRHLAGAWRETYVITAVIALYFNFFVLIVQSFQKIPALKALAPTQTEPPFAIAQGAALVMFIVLGVLAVRRFRPPLI